MIEFKELKEVYQQEHNAGFVMELVMTDFWLNVIPIETISNEKLEEIIILELALISNLENLDVSSWKAKFYINLYRKGYFNLTRLGVSTLFYNLY